MPPPVWRGPTILAGPSPVTGPPRRLYSTGPTCEGRHSRDLAAPSPSTRSRLLPGRATLVGAAEVDHLVAADLAEEAGAAQGADPLLLRLVAARVDRRARRRVVAVRDRRDRADLD